ncbi:hypothetical protein [Aidingimonas halophila]|uniref:Membrane-associated protein n=1 Tax=Aidingimonas halophila TaxID=574349 RepID=A0A1H3DDC5_9GAMM|nr:hypothetical protein [Aidingimonas halophila]GHC30093.1 hypothetical protein GCM10008094_22910 [Aidingimonas halophila]SDX64386.1 hypothetical protein SAMN05443545_106256 [Aidingimonas halophila]
MARMHERRLPWWPKWLFSLWILCWAPTYVVLLGPQNFLWLCNLANFLILVALWTESRRLMSMQLLAVLLVGTLWAVDVGTALVTGWHPIGGTEYMFDPDHPAVTRALSLYHLILPIVASLSVWRLGFDRRAILWQTGLTWLIVPLSYAITDPERNINWVHGPFGQPQESLDPLVYLVGLMVAWPLAVYLPVQLLMICLQRWRSIS